MFLDKMLSVLVFNDLSLLALSGNNILVNQRGCHVLLRPLPNVWQFSNMLKITLRVREKLTWRFKKLTQD